MFTRPGRDDPPVPRMNGMTKHSSVSISNTCTKLRQKGDCTRVMTACSIRTVYRSGSFFSTSLLVTRLIANNSPVVLLVTALTCGRHSSHTASRTRQCECTPEPIKQQHWGRHANVPCQNRLCPPPSCTQSGNCRLCIHTQITTTETPISRAAKNNARLRRRTHNTEKRHTVCAGTY